MNNETKAETQQVPLPSSVIPGVSGATEGAVSVGGLLALVVSLLLHWRRKNSRDGSEMVKDRTESELFRNMIVDREGILQDRDAARKSEREAWDKANALAVVNASQTAKIEYQAQEIARLMGMVAEMQTTLDEMKRRIQQLSKNATGNTGFDDPHPPVTP